MGIWPQARNPPANRTRGNKKNVARDQSRFCLGSNSPVLLSSMNSIFNARDQTLANLLKSRRLFSFGIKCQFLQQHPGESSVLTEVFVMRFGDTHELVEQGAVRMGRPQRQVGNGSEFLIEDQKNQVALVLCIIEHSSKADMRTFGDLTKGRGLVSMLGKELASSDADTLTLLHLVLF